MIEFKGDCGHTVRARDEDAGTVVRCSYCGRKATVPDGKSDDLDLLFKDSGGTDQVFLAGARLKKPRRWLLRRGPRRPRKFDAFAIVLRMCYAALLLIIVIVVGKKCVAPLFKEGGWPPWVAEEKKEKPPDSKTSAPDPGVETRRRGGLISRTCARGLYVNSTPDGADVYCVEASKVTGVGRIRLLPEVVHNRVTADGACFQRLPGSGPYVVEVTMKLNDRKLFDPKLDFFESYRTLRKKIEELPDLKQSRALLEEYFVPDGAAAVFADKSEGQIYLVRQYRDVVFSRDGTASVRAMFLPKVLPGGSDRFSVGRLLGTYIPNQKAYNFDEEFVRFELIYQGVAEPDLKYVLDALYRIGVIPYHIADGKIKLFMIGVDDGEPTAVVIGEAKNDSRGDDG